jgi:hypothetical protein
MHNSFLMKLFSWNALSTCFHIVVCKFTLCSNLYNKSTKANYIRSNIVQYDILTETTTVSLISFSYTHEIGNFNFNIILLRNNFGTWKKATEIAFNPENIWYFLYRIFISLSCSNWKNKTRSRNKARSNCENSIISNRIWYMTELNEITKNKYYSMWFYERLQKLSTHNIFPLKIKYEANKNWSWDFSVNLNTIFYYLRRSWFFNFSFLFDWIIE